MSDILGTSIFTLIYYLFKLNFVARSKRLEFDKSGRHSPNLYRRDPASSDRKHSYLLLGRNSIWGRLGSSAHLKVCLRIYMKIYRLRFYLFGFRFGNWGF